MEDDPSSFSNSIIIDTDAKSVSENSNNNSDDESSTTTTWSYPIVRKQRGPNLERGDSIQNNNYNNNLQVEKAEFTRVKSESEFRARSKVEGTLSLKRGIWGGWKPSYFKLENGNIYQYNRKEDIKKKIRCKYIKACDCTILDVSSVFGKPYTFCLSRRDKSNIILRADTKDEFEIWFLAISVSFSSSPRALHTNLIIQALSLIPNKQIDVYTFDVAAVVSDSKGKIIDFNKSAELVFGYTKSEVLKKNVRLLMTKFDSKFHNSFVKKYTKTHNRSLIGRVRQVKGLRKDQSVIKLNICLGEFYEGGKRYFMASFQLYDNESPMKLISTTDDSSSLSSSVRSDRINSYSTVINNNNNNDDQEYKYESEEDDSINWSEEE